MPAARILADFSCMDAADTWKASSTASAVTPDKPLPSVLSPAAVFAPAIIARETVSRNSPLENQLMPAPPVAS